MKTESSSLTPRLVIGGALAAFGIIELLDNFRLIDSGRVPLLGATLIMLGISFWLTGANRVVAGLLAGFGAWGVLDRLGFVNVEMLELWPIAVIVIGLSIFWKSWKGADSRQPSQTPVPHTDDQVNGAAIFSDQTVRITTETSGGSFFSLFSGPTIDLSDARIREGAVLHLLTVAAGTKVIIPDDCVVSSRVFPFMAGYEDKTRSRDEVRQKLTIRGFTMWGGIEVHDGATTRRKREQS